MCAVSMVSDYYRGIWPERYPNNPTPWTTDPDLARMIKEAFEKLDAIDKRLKDTECNEPSKEQFLKEITDSANGQKT